MSYDNLSSVSQNVLKFYQQLSGEEWRIPFIFDDFQSCRSRVIGLDVTENRIFTWVVFFRMFWNFISSLPVKRGGSLSFLVRTISNVLVMEIGWTDVGSEGYILLNCAHSNASCFCFCLIFLILFFLLILLVIYVVFLFFCFRAVSFVQCCLCHWFVRSWLLCQFYLTFIYSMKTCICKI